MQDHCLSEKLNSREVKKAYLEEFISKSKKRLKKIFKQLKWVDQKQFKNFNSNSGTLRGSDVNAAELWLPPNLNATNSVVISQDELRSIVSNPNAVIPQKFSDIQINFSREQKLRVYEYVLEHTQKLVEPELTAPVDEVSNLTFAQIVAAKKREKKQKRRKYRTSKPTHIEEVRNLVILQMQAMEQYLKRNKKPKSLLKRHLEEQERYLSRRDNRSSSRRPNTFRRYSPTKRLSFSRTRSPLMRFSSRSRRRSRSRNRSGSSKHSDTRTPTISRKHSRSRDRRLSSSKYSYNGVRDKERKRKEPSHSRSRDVFRNRRSRSHSKVNSSKERAYRKKRRRSEGTIKMGQK